MLEMQVVQPKVEMEVDPAKVVYQDGGGGNVSSEQIDYIVRLDRAAYDALPVKDARTLYLIDG